MLAPLLVLLPFFGAALDARTLHLMFFPGATKLYCFGEERTSGFRFANYIVSL